MNTILFESQRIKKYRYAYLGQFNPQHLKQYSSRILEVIELDTPKSILITQFELFNNLRSNKINLKTKTKTSYFIYLITLILNKL